MGRLRESTSFLSLLVSLLALTALGITVLERPVVAQTGPEAQPDTELARVIQVSGHGEVQVQPDMAVVHVGVETQADTATEALDENNVRMSEVISATIGAGVAEQDVETQGLQLLPIYTEPGQAGGAPTLTGYRARNVVEVTARDLEALGALLDAVVEAGGNTIEGIRFDVSNLDEVRAQAREQAMDNAREKAEQLTTLAGAELGEVLSISEGAVTPPPQPLAEGEAAADEAVPVAPGTQIIETDIQVSWRIR